MAEQFNAILTGETSPERGASPSKVIARQPRIDQRVAILVIEDQGRVQEALGLSGTLIVHPLGRIF